MASIKFLTWNVRGLREPLKRSATFTFLKKQRADVIALVETHMDGKLQMALRRPWVGWAFHSTFTSHSRGVSILIAKSIHFELGEICIDPQGRYVFISAKLYGEPFLILAFYVPPPFSITIILEGVSFMARYPTVQAVWMGDFNSTMNDALDRLRPLTLAAMRTNDTKLHKITSSIHLIDTWRHKFPHTKAYSCFSSTHNSMSRIDFILISKQLLPRLLTVSFGPRLLSDHSFYSITLSVSLAKQKRTWRLNPFWLSLLPEDDMLEVEWTRFFTDNEHSAPAPVVWDTFKLHVRAVLTSRINQIKTNSAEALDKAIIELSSSEQAYIADPSITNANTLKLQTRVVSQIQYVKAKQKLFFNRQRWFEHGEKAGKLLSYLVHSEDKPPIVITLHDKDRQPITDPFVVSSKFRDFFTELYTSTVSEDTTIMDHFLSNIILPQLSESQVELLEAPLTVEEIKFAIADFTRSKSPGSDGLPIEFYAHFSEILIPKLLSLYNTMFETSTLPASMREATIVLIPKPGKDLGYPESYRPISLLQVDVKILAKVLSKRLNQVILSLIHIDQSGFMPGRNTSFNLRKLFINLQAKHDNVGTRVIVTLDTAKAFDSVEWSYLWRCMEGYGFGPKFIRWVQLLYQQPTARVVANGCPSREFGLSRGTRQGCPLSPLLYALASEPLAVSIRTNQEIIGLTFGSLTEKISLYADDTLLYLADPGLSLHTALNVIEQFGTFSGLRINWGKSQILPIDSFPPTESQANLPLQRVDIIKYLGVKISKNPVDYISLNVEPLFSLIKSKIQVWSRLPLGVWGRVNLIKMVLLPKVLYVLWHTPVYLPLKYFKLLETLLKPFIWGKSRHKLSWQTLKNSTDMGGTALPDFNHYYIASQLSQLFHIDKTDKERFLILLSPRWVQYTRDPINGIAVGVGNTQSKDYRHSLLYHYRRIWELASSKLETTSFNDYTPLWHNNKLQELNGIQNSDLWAAKGIYYLHHLFTNGTFKTFEALKMEFQIPNQMFYCYLQIRHAIQTQFSGGLPQPTPNPIIAIVKDTDSKKLISCFYNMLSAPTSAKLAYALKPRWEREVGRMEDEEWEEALETCKLVSPKLSDRLSQIYILHRAYLTPLRVARYKRSQSITCPMCGTETGTFFHLIWSCQKIQDYWKQIVAFLHDDMGSPLTLDPKQCLLGIFPDVLDKFTMIFLHETLFSARKIIARQWMRSEPPQLVDWKRDINTTLPYKKFLYINRGCPNKYNRIWDRWLQESTTCT